MLSWIIAQRAHESAPSLFRSTLRALLVGAAATALACEDPAGRESISEPTASSSRAGAARAGERFVELTRDGLYRVSLRPETGPVRPGPIHAWRILVETPDGEPVTPSRLTFSGGMPQHGHGLPTAPRVTTAIGAGEYRVEGVRFHMSGSWTIRVELVGPRGPDLALFELQVAP